MPLKTGWTAHLRATRLCETERIFGRCPDGAFARGLELGGGDGFQARLLLRWVRALVSTDYHQSILDGPAAPGLSFQVCDAERADQIFPAGSFDLIFSSNLLEHLLDVQRALAATLTLLRPGGIAVHVMPGVEWKLAQLALHYPNLLAVALDRLLGPAPLAAPRGERPNNAKQPERSTRWRLLWPQPHGISRTNLGELFAFRQARWEREFASAGLEVIAALPGPVSSGFGFGFDRLRAWLERAGVSTETAYVLARPGEGAAARAWFSC